MTAEFALVVPAALLLLIGMLGVLQIGSVPVRLTDAAADAARLVGRGEPEAAQQRVRDAQTGATLAVEHDGAIVCVVVSAEVVPLGFGPAVTFTGRGCALDDTASLGSDGAAP